MSAIRRVIQTKERARKAREDGPLGEKPDAHALEWTLPGTRRVWNVVFGSLASVAGLIPVFIDDLNLVAIGALASMVVAVGVWWALYTTHDLTIAIDHHSLTWSRGKERGRVALADIHEVRWERLGTTWASQGAEKVHGVRLIVDTAGGELVIGGLSMTQLRGAKKKLDYGELLTADDYSHLCAQITEAVSRARASGTERDVPEAMRRLAAKAREG